MPESLGTLCAHEYDLISPLYRSKNALSHKNHLNWPLRYNPIQNKSDQNSNLQLNTTLNEQKNFTPFEQSHNHVQLQNVNIPEQCDLNNLKQINSNFILFKI